MSHFIDLTGKTFGDLLVLGIANERVFPSGQRRYQWHVECACGSPSVVDGLNLRSGHTKSCGCRLRENPGPRLRETVGYFAAHGRVKRQRGFADEHRCVDCDSAAAEWSYDHADPEERVELVNSKWLLRYSLNASHYQPRCMPCHRRFDAARRRARRQVAIEYVTGATS